MYFDDDSKGECFRKYASAAESYRDHSTFLTSKERYASLFQLNIRDYKAWARGLKKAGYATHPQYAEKLIDIIERMKLYEYDYQVDTPSDELKGTEILAQTAENEVVEADSKSTRKKTTTSNSSINARSQASLAIDASYLSNALHAKKENSNKVAFVVARKGDTYYKLAKEFDLALWQLYRYNDFEAKKDLLDEGDIVYLEPKRNRSKDKNAVYIAKTTVQLCQVSQSEGIKLKKLEKMNPNLTNQEAIQKGQKVLLR
jgi:LysM repeat protein